MVLIPTEGLAKPFPFHAEENLKTEDYILPDHVMSAT